MPNFIHLHCHTEYSLLESSVRIKQLIERCVELGMNSVAITDNGGMFGAIEFYLAAKAKGIKPIIGCEVYLTKDMTIKERGWDRLILLAQNNIGYQNLVKLVTISNLEGFYYKPRIDLLRLAEYSDGLIAISPGMRGPVAYQLQRDQTEQAEVVAVALQKIYPDRFYLGVQALGVPMEEKVREETIYLAKKLHLPLVATNDVYYLDQESAPLRNVLMCIQTGTLLDDNIRAQTQSTEMYLKSSEEMTALFPDIPDAIDNTVHIADQCLWEMDTERVTLPRFECPDNKTSEAYLEELTWFGIEKKYGTVTPEIQERVSFELSIIIKMGYPIYFLIIYDFLNFCRQNGIPVGPGRGSAAGSIVAYALNITNIDPLKYKLLFERFLNPERVSMPDIDLDFCIRRRNEVIEYIVNKYGTDHVSQIATFGTMAARGVIRDVGRVLGIPLADVDRIAKLIPAIPGQHISIPQAMEMIPDLKKVYESSPEYKNFLDTAAKLEGLARHTSTHAAGIVISSEPLDTVVPLIRNEGQIATQYSMTDLEKIGLLKMDILGLRNLTVIDDALKCIQKRTGTTIHFETLDVNDKTTYDLLCSGQTTGVFQLESRGMRELVKRLQPTVFEDIIALLALYRPGPLGSGMVDEFISNKSGLTEVKYELPALEPILKDTYGMIVYQEQVMQIASAIGGFSLGQADMLRRAMGKKKKEEMDKMKQLFLDGAKMNGHPLDKAEKIFELCYKFAEYGFNKSHSAAYALISYQTAYLKVHYPKEYMSALLSSVVGNSDKILLYIQECRSLGIQVLVPDINESFSDFTIVGNHIRFGLGAIKNVGTGAIESIILNRLKKPYSSLFDFCQAVDLRQVNKRVVESLIKSGAMDQFGNRNELLGTYEQVMDYAQTVVKEKSNGQISLFSAAQEETQIQDFQPENRVSYSKNELLRMEKELLSIYLTGHPLDILAEQMKALPYNTSTITVEDDEKVVTLIGILSGCRKIVNKNKREMILAIFEDLHGELPIVLFQSKNFEKLAPLFQDDAIVQLKGRISVKDDEISLYCEDISILDMAIPLKQLHIVADDIDEADVFTKIQEILGQHYGEIPVHIHYFDTTILAHPKYWVKNANVCLDSLQAILGPGNIWITQPGIKVAAKS